MRPRGRFPSRERQAHVIFGSPGRFVSLVVRRIVVQRIDVSQGAWQIHEAVVRSATSHDVMDDEGEHMSDTALSLFAQGDLAFKRGRWRPALAAFAGVAETCPAHFKARFRIADALLNLGKRDLALEAYKSLAWHGIKSGYPLVGLVAVKMVLLLEPAYEDILWVLAELYSRDSDRISGENGPAVPELPETPASPLPIDDDLIARAAKAACFDEEAATYPRALPTIPLFSHLDEDAFIHVLEKLRLRRYADDELIIKQGERGDSFFIVADGDVLVKRDLDRDGGITLAHLHRGAVFGEMALISDEPRQASVVARGDVDVLELRRSDLIIAASQLESVTDALKAFTRERFLGNLTATHPFFTSLSREDRHRVMDSFTPVQFDAEQPMILEGEAGPGLYLLLAGVAEVSKHTGNEQIHLASLRAGDVCGEMSLVHAQPTTANVVARESVEALFLSRSGFEEVVRDHPDLLAYLSSLNDERLRQNHALLHARGLLEDDEHVMI